MYYFSNHPIFIIVYNGGANEHNFLPLFLFSGIVSMFTAVVLCRWIDGTLLFSSSFFPYVGFAFPSVYTSDFRSVGLSFFI